MDFLTYLFLDPDHQKIMIAAGLGALIGLERELSGKDPSLRTFSLICMGSCLFALVSRYSPQGFTNADPARVSAQVVTGIGFLGAGTIFRSKAKIQGLTTAALMWLTAAVGLAVGLGRQELGCSATVLALLIIICLKLVHKTIRWAFPKNYNLGSDGD